MTEADRKVVWTRIGALNKVDPIAEQPQRRMDTLTLTNLGHLFRPRSVAVIGASPTRGSPRNSLLRVLLQHGFEGKVYPVSPTHSEVEGLTAYKSILDLPETPDVALIITPAKTVPKIIEECGQKGTRAAIVFSAGFEETSEGKEIAVQLAAAARAHGVTIIGPNCQGIWSVRDKALMTYSPAAMNLEQTRHSPIAIVSQSGAIAGALSSSLHRNGLGCCYMVSVGNETVFDALDATSWLVDQEDVRVIALYIEGLQRAERILEIAERARRRDVRIVMLKAGRSEIGLQTTASHTGKIASSYAVYSDVLQQAGVVSLSNLGELLAAVEVLAFMALPRQSGDANGGVSTLSSSGGAAALLADHSSELGIPLATFSDATAKRLDDLLPDFARKENPIDLTGQINSVANLFRDACLTVAADPRTEAVVVQHANSGRRYLGIDGEIYKQVARDMPVVVSFVGETLPPETRKEFRDAGVLLSPEPYATMSALALLYRFRNYQSLPAAPLSDPAARRMAPQGWAQTMAYCEEAGATPAKWVALGASQRAEEACAGLRYPVVVKVMPSDADHKTELGLVKLRVGSAADIDRTAADFRSRMGKPHADILIQEMVDDGGVEVVLSFLRKTDFGPIMSIGSGGVAVELYRDVTHLALPVTPEQVRVALGRLKLWTLLQGFRGKPAADVDTLVAAAARLGDQFLASPEIQEFELNPVIVNRQGSGVRVVDALVVVSKA
jgi:acyl-CoA synthetase (NDP forming)